MQKLAVTYRQVADLIPYARNARTHSDEQVARIAASIKEYGWTNPILIDGEKGIIAGHGRLAAARKLGLTEVPTIELAGLTEAQKRAYILADNRIALDASWDYDMLRVEVSDLFADGENQNLITGFSKPELDALLTGVSVDSLNEVDLDETCSVTVDFESSEDAERFFNEMQARGLKCRLST